MTNTPVLARRHDCLMTNLRMEHAAYAAAGPVLSFKRRPKSLTLMPTDQYSIGHTPKTVQRSARLPSQGSVMFLRSKLC